MPYVLNEFKAKIQFVTSARMPSLIYKACVRTGCPSNTEYIRRAVAEALARDLGVPLEEITADLPKPRTHEGLFGDNRRRLRRESVGSAATVEQVR
jgi:hypothetical protein